MLRDPGNLYYKMPDGYIPCVDRCTVTHIDIPAPDAPCTLGLWMPDASPSLAADSRYAIRCANAIPFSDGVNVLGRVCG